MPRCGVEARTESRAADVTGPERSKKLAARASWALLPYIGFHCDKSIQREKAEAALSVAVRQAETARDALARILRWADNAKKPGDFGAIAVIAREALAALSAGATAEKEPRKVCTCPHLSGVFRTDSPGCPLHGATAEETGGEE